MDLIQSYILRHNITTQWPFKGHQRGRYASHCPWGNNFPSNATFHLPGICWAFYWSMLKVAVTLRINHWLLNQVNLWQGPLRSRSIAWWCNCPVVVGVVSDGWFWVCRQRIYSTKRPNHITNLKGPVNERKLLVCHAYICIYTDVFSV